MKIDQTRVKEGKPESSAAREATLPDKGSAIPEPTETTAREDAKMPAVPHPIEVPMTTTPGQPNLVPTPERLAKIDEEKGEGGRDEETVSLDSTDFTYTSYLHGVKFKIEGVWRYPEAARKSALQGRGLVSFTIERDGTVSNINLISSSGYPVLDEEIKKAIRGAAPFNPMTDNMHIKRLNVVATFEYNLVVQRIWGR